MAAARSTLRNLLRTYRRCSKSPRARASTASRHSGGKGAPAGRGEEASPWPLLWRHRTLPARQLLQKRHKLDSGARGACGRQLRTAPAGHLLGILRIATCLETGCPERRLSSDDSIGQGCVQRKQLEACGDHIRDTVTR